MLRYRCSKFQLCLIETGCHTLNFCANGSYFPQLSSLTYKIDQFWKIRIDPLELR